MPTDRTRTRYDLLRSEIGITMTDDEFRDEAIKIMAAFVSQETAESRIDQRDAKTALCIAHQVIKAYGIIAKQVGLDKESMKDTHSKTVSNPISLNVRQDAYLALSQIYLNPVNEFIRDILEHIIPSQSLSSQFGFNIGVDEIAGAAIDILQKTKLKTKYDVNTRTPEVHAAYILGRIRYDRYGAQDTLAQLEKKLDRSIRKQEVKLESNMTRQDKPHNTFDNVSIKGNTISSKDQDYTLRHLQLLRRSVLLSQAKLGGRKALERYIEYLHNSYLQMDINAGFHLEYYCDQKRSRFQPLCSRDYGQSCSNTMAYLVESLHSKTSGDCKGMSEPFTVVQIFTLASIIAKRIHGEYYINHKQDFQRALRTLERICIRLQELENIGDNEILPIRHDMTLLTDTILFVELLLDVYRHGPDFPIEQFSRYLASKNAPRNGWIERGVEFPETVGAHTASLTWLCNLLAHYNAADPSINLLQLRRMLELHDIAEGITSDIPVRRQSKGSKEEERKYMRKLSWLGIYLQPNLDLFDCYKVYKEFYTQSTLTARVAHDLDKLDIVIQGFSIINSDADCDREMIKDLIHASENLITTEQIRALLPLAKKMTIITRESFGSSDSKMRRYFFSP